MSAFERIRARADGAVSKLTNSVFTMHDGLAAVGDRVMLLDALQAVLDMHKPQPVPNRPDAQECSNCIDCCSYDSWPAPYPCETVTAIMTILEREP